MDETEKYYYVYILTNEKNGMFYTGVTNDLIRRVVEHRMKLINGFAEKYNLLKLVYFETHKYINDAIEREKRIKKWNRSWKIHLIEKQNKEWRDLLMDFVSEEDIKSITEFLREQNQIPDRSIRG
jgi:putative endonuclease